MVPMFRCCDPGWTNLTAKVWMHGVTALNLGTSAFTLNSRKPSSPQERVAPVVQKKQICPSARSAEASSSRGPAESLCPIQGFLPQPASQAAAALSDTLREKRNDFL